MSTTNDIKEEIKRILNVIKTHSFYSQFFKNQLSRLVERASFILRSLDRTEVLDATKLNLLMMNLRSLQSFIQTVRMSTGTTVYIRQADMKYELGVYYNRILSSSTDLGLVGATTQAENLQKRNEDLEDDRKDTATLMAYIIANPGSVKKELRVYTRTDARTALKTLLARRSALDKNDMTEGPILSDAIQILQQIVGASPDQALEHDFPAVRPTPATPAPRRARTQSFNVGPRPNTAVPQPPNLVSTPPAFTKLPSPTTSPLVSPRGLPLREGSGIFTTIKYTSDDGVTRTYEPFGTRWMWGDPMSVSEAIAPRDFLVQPGMVTRVIALHRWENTSIVHGLRHSLIAKSRLKFLNCRAGAEVTVLGLFKVRNTVWAAGMTGSGIGMAKELGLVPLECLGPENGTPALEPKIISRALHEHARPFIGSRKVSGALARPIKGLVSRNYFSYFDDIPDGHEVGFYHYLADVKCTKSMKAAITVEGVGMVKNVPSIVMVENGKTHEFLFETQQMMIQVFDDIRRMQLRGGWIKVA